MTRKTHMTKKSHPARDRRDQGWSKDHGLNLTLSKL